MTKEYVLQTIEEAIDAWGLGYAIETTNLDSEDLEDHEELCELVRTAYVSMKKIKDIVGR